MSAHKFPAEVRAKEMDDFLPELDAYYQSADAMEFDGSEIKKVDTAGMQALVVLAHHLRQEDREFSWSATSPVLLESAQCMGASDVLGLPAA
ncbi:MAG: STAS domain-containing protein [Pseudomonadota bacterium]